MFSVRVSLVGLVAAAGLVVAVGGLATPVSAAKRAPAKVIDPVTMGALQIVNAIDGDAAMTVSVGGRVRARGVPSLVATAPVVVPAGDQVISIGVGSAEAVGSVSVNVPAGSRRTMFLVGRPDAPRVSFVDAPDRLATTRSVRFVDLRAPGSRSAVQVSGVVRAVDASGVSTLFTTPASAPIVVNGTSTTADIKPGTSIVFVTDRGPRVVASALGQAVVGLDSLRSPAPPIVKVHQSPMRLIGALALVITATIGALSSMTVFRSRSRDERTRGLMAKSFVI
jgi:hypothetical protein